MGFLQRIQEAFYTVREAPQRLTEKASPYFWNYANDRPIWNLSNYLSYAREGFNHNALIYAAIMYKAQAIASTRLRVYSGDIDNPIPNHNHPLVSLLARPNPQQSAPEFEGLNMVYLNIGGNAYIYLDRGDKSTGRPIAMYPLRPDRVRLVPDTRGIKGFLYVPPGKSENDTVPFLPEDVIHIKFPNPDDPFEGMGYGQSPISASGQSGDVDNHLTAFVKLFIERGAMPTGLLKFNMLMDDKMVAEARRKWLKRYGGANNWANVAVLDQNGDYKQLGLSFRDMGFADIDERNETRILMSLGVPGILLNSRSGMKNSTYSNIQEARESFWDDRMRYEMNLFDEEYGHFLNEEGVFVQRDLSQVPALQKRILSQAQAARSMWDMGVPANTAFRSVGLRIGDIPDGDKPFGGRSQNASGAAPTTLAAAERRLSQRQPALPAGDIDEDEEGYEQRSGLERLPAQAQKSFSEEKKTLLWKAADDIARSHEEEFGAAARDCFEKDKRGVLAILEENAKAAASRKATIDWLKPSKAINDYLSESARKTWRKGFTPRMSALVNDAGRMWAAELGHQWNVRNFMAEAWFADYTLVFAQPINETSSNVIQSILAQAQAEGWSTYTMQERLGLVFQQWMDGDLAPSDFAWITDRMPAYRRELIARTETTRLTSAGSVELFKEWEVGDKEWLSTPDDRCRATHVAANGQVVPIDKPFKVGGFDMMYPGDMSQGAPIREAAACRCTVLPVV